MIAPRQNSTPRRLVPEVLHERTHNFNRIYYMNVIISGIFAVVFYQTVNTESLNIKQETPKTQNVNIRNWQNAQFKMNMYRYPFTTIVMVFIPILLLAIINLAIFFQDNTFSNRVASIATLMVAYTAFLPTVQSSIPPSPVITLFDIIMYSLLLTSILCLLRGFLDRYEPSETYVYDWQNDPILFISLFIVALSVFIVVFGLCIYKFSWQKKYNEGEEQLKHQRKIDFKSEEWTNIKCDEYFQNLNKDNIVRQIRLNDFSEDTEVNEAF